MKAGIIATIRFNPEDVMSCVDIVNRAGAYVPGMSISQCIKMACAALLQAARDQAIVPVRDGFEYTEMTKQFVHGGRQGRKLAVTAAIESAELGRLNVDKPASPITAMQSLTRPAGTDDDFDIAARKRARLLIRIEELKFKKNNDVANWTEAEEVELNAKQSEYDVLGMVKPS